MAVKKSALYSRLWDSCNTLRSKGGMDATQYKDYVLIILFMKVITDKYYGKKNSIITVPKEANFNTMIELKNKKNIGEMFNKILKKIAEENDLQNIIDVVDFNDETKLGKGKDKVDALTGLVEIFQDPELDFSNNRADDDDILGDAYEYLMKQFASEAGKSKGQFYTPSEVSRVMAKIIGINETKKSQIYVYDMACGSGSLLLKAGAEAPDNVKVNLYGQEKDNNTAGLAVMNMFLHGNPTAVIKADNTLTKPQFIENKKIKTFDYCVANPPFSVKKWSSGMENQYNRFTLGMPPENCADYAFLLHMLTSMEPENGRGAIILPHGVLFRGGQEEIIRTNLIKRGYIEGIIGLPFNLFYGTGIPACIIVLDKKNASSRKSIFVIDASKCFTKDGSKNKLREEDIKRIVDAYISKDNIERFSRNVDIIEIEKEGYNLNIARYIDSTEEEIEQNIYAHLNGGIPEKNINSYQKYWNIASQLKDSLFSRFHDGFYKLNISKNEIFDVIEKSDELNMYKNKIIDKFIKWKELNKNSLLTINGETKIKEIIKSISDSMFDIYTDDELISNYDAYECLMEYINDVMKDDLHIIVENGWIPKLIFSKDKKGNVKKNEFESDLLPKEIVTKHYFKAENSELEKLSNELSDLISFFNEKVEINMGEDLIFNEEEKINDKYLKNLKSNASDEEIIIIDELLTNLASQKEMKKQIKVLQEKLNQKIIAKYSELSEEEFKELIIEKKWYCMLCLKFESNFEDQVYKLSNDILDTVNNYEFTLNEMIKETALLENKVLEDLKKVISNE